MGWLIFAGGVIVGGAVGSVSYTHLDVYKRQALISAVLEPIIPPKRRKATA